MNPSFLDNELQLSKGKQCSLISLILGKGGSGTDGGPTQ